MVRHRARRPAIAPPFHSGPGAAKITVYRGESV